MVRSALLAATILMAAPAALAQCPETELQQAVDRFNLIGAADAGMTRLANVSLHQIERCKDDPHVLKVTALALANASINTTDDNLRLNWADGAWRAWLAMLDHIPGANAPEPRRVQMGAVQTPIDFNGMPDTSKSLVTMLLGAEERTGRTTPSSQPAEPGVSYTQVCGYYHGSLARAVNDVVRDHPQVTSAWNLMDRIAQSCRGDQGPNALNTREVRASAALRWARANPDAPEALPRLLKAADDSHVILKASSSGSMFWKRPNEDDLLTQLAKAMAANNHSAPQDEWFKPERIEHPEVMASIGLAIDAAWAEDSRVGISGAYANYRKVVSDSLAAINKLDDPEKRARWSLYRALNAHAKGTIRRPENASLRAPPEFLYNWVSPAYRAPG